MDTSFTISVSSSGAPGGASSSSKSLAHSYLYDDTLHPYKRPVMDSFTYRCMGGKPRRSSARRTPVKSLLEADLKATKSLTAPHSPGLKASAVAAAAKKSGRP